MTEPTLLSLIRQVRAQRSSQPDALEGERLGELPDGDAAQEGDGCADDEAAGNNT